MTNDDGHRALREHARTCDECAASPPPTERIAEQLDRIAMPADPAILSRRVLAGARGLLEAHAARRQRRRLARALALALLPLSLVVAYDALILQAVHALLSSFLPAGVATVLVLNYAAFLVLLFAATYATIPLLLSRTARPEAAAWGTPG